MTTLRGDLYQSITNHIIAAIEAGAGKWKMPWHAQDGGTLALPINAITGKAYRGINPLILWAASQAAAYPTGRWATYKQWTNSGARVRKGEKSTTVVFWKHIETEDDAEVEEGKCRHIVARGFHVFNAAQVDGFEMPNLPVLPEIERVAHADNFFTALAAEIRHGGSRAYYSMAGDYIQLPPFAAFSEPATYYTTLAHEATHWSGHTDRCNRNLTGRFGSEAYAAEEIIAELGAAFICADLALANEPRPDHAAYIASWLKVLKADKRAIFTAAAWAQKAADFMYEWKLVAG